uniref:Lipoprotein n=1 Tax=Rhizophora mucronata TaxID=61149 RepID=A0A2P2QQZ3_RHIMU
MALPLLKKITFYLEKISFFCCVVLCCFFMLSSCSGIQQILDFGVMDLYFTYVQTLTR